MRCIVLAGDVEDRSIPLTGPVVLVGIVGGG